MDDRFPVLLDRLTRHPLPFASYVVALASASWLSTYPTADWAGLVFELGRFTVIAIVLRAVWRWVSRRRGANRGDAAARALLIWSLWMIGSLAEAAPVAGIVGAASAGLIVSLVTGYVWSSLIQPQTV